MLIKKTTTLVMTVTLFSMCCCDVINRKIPSLSYTLSLADYHTLSVSSFVVRSLIQCHSICLQTQEQYQLIYNPTLKECVCHVNILCSSDYDLETYHQPAEQLIIKGSLVPALSAAACNASILNDGDCRVPDAAITAATFWDHSTCWIPGIRLWDDAADQQWCAVAGNPDGQWVKIDFGVLRRVTGVMLRARALHAQWITSFEIEYLDGSDWVVVKDLDNNDMVFIGIEDQLVPVYREMPISFMTTQLKFVPITYHNHYTTRLDIRGC